ncbi:DUF3892 domain-containing protein [Oceanobacillus arenosus]|uniref:DUF3892 domain-containing protein n=1 Tax=Oceanobacillus arenosus TaxID=1229153 RepID=A0A3D8PQF5_9BACI|nr:DUF3892 domain-containing protein [Oceanobacillus arenosus]RDW18333.1 DUF3892 domain-containing protein [Oceanobacillus arenosus]
MQKNFEKIYNEYRNQSEQQTSFDARQELLDGQEEIIAVRKNDSGDMIAFKTNTGRELDYLIALNEAKAGKIAHIDVFHKYGKDIIRSQPDGIIENNLSNLPQF